MPGKKLLSNINQNCVSDTRLIQPLDNYKKLTLVIAKTTHSVVSVEI